MALSLAVVALAVTAGCAGVLGGGEGDRDPYDVPPPTATATATATASGDDSPAFGPFGRRIPPSDGRALGESDVFAAHDVRIRAAGNVTITRTETVSRDNATTSREFAYRIDFDRDRYWSRVVESGPRWTTTRVAYVAGETLYRKTVAGGGDPTYETVRDPARNGTTVGDLPPGAVRGLLVNQGLAANLEPDGTVTFEGRTVRRYTATTLPDETRRSFRSVAEFELTMLVDDDGVVRLFEYTILARTAVGERYYEHSRLTVRDLGNTTVSRPGWVGNATAGG